MPLPKCLYAFVSILLLSMTPLLQAEPLRVVASFSVLGDMVRQVGGDKVEVTELVGANGDAHLFQPTPRSAKSIKQADIVIFNGLGFEGWMDRLLETAEFSGKRVVATRSIEPIRLEEEEEESDHEDEYDEHHKHGEDDPHAWHSIPLGISYVRNITDALIEEDPDNAHYYRQNSDTYIAHLTQLDQQLKAALAEVPVYRRRIITPHDAFGYLALEYDLHIEAPQGYSTESEASARQLAELILQVRMNNISAAFLENVANTALVRQIQEETKLRFGGTLYSDALSETTGPAGTYADMMEHNLSTIIEAIRLQ